MLKNWLENTENSNKINSEIESEKNKKSLFVIETLF